MKYAWIENNIVRDVCHGIPSECYTPNVAELYTAQVPEDAANGDGWDGTTLTKPVVPTPVPAPRAISVEQVRAGLTLTEKVKWDNDSAPEVTTAKIEFATPRTVADATDVLAFLVAANVISSASEAKILA